MARSLDGFQMSKTGFKIQFSRKVHKLQKCFKMLLFTDLFVFCFIKLQTLNANTLSQSDFKKKIKKKR